MHVKLINNTSLATESLVCVIKLILTTSTVLDGVSQSEMSYMSQ